MRVAAGVVCLALLGCGSDGGGHVAEDRANDHVRPTVVEIVTTRCDSPTARAIGFVVADGRIVTVAHTIADASTVTVAGIEVVVEVVDPGADVAVLGSIAGTVAVDVAFADPVAGPAVVATPESDRAVTVVRTVTLRGGDIDGDGDHARPGMELRAVIREGDSGAPVLDPSGSVVGMVTARSRRTEDRAWAVGASAIRSTLEGRVSAIPVPMTVCAAD